MEIRELAQEIINVGGGLKVSPSDKKDDYRVNVRKSFTSKDGKYTVRVNADVYLTEVKNKAATKPADVKVTL